MKYFRQTSHIGTENSCILKIAAIWISSLVCAEYSHPDVNTSVCFFIGSFNITNWLLTQKYHQNWPKNVNVNTRGGSRTVATSNIS